MNKLILEHDVTRRLTGSNHDHKPHFIHLKNYLRMSGRIQKIYVRLNSLSSR